ncbi:arsenate reductase ArsC [Streptomyces sp. NBC_01619]|uniref:arsenate-mycothiol transferase ArsC n=1 Tax=Streptomyces sp. NBC_01619 TaxID=2975901 RepID=UPI0022527338|nr:arsenate reductase ArsC [Streptomyces sp. NBC_01619]MCX4510687.1 arsenate reductase ArsC [Streptomyces sp. NBC_01619]
MDERNALGPATPQLRDIDAVVERITRRLRTRYGHVFSQETVESYVDDCALLLRCRARLGTHLPVLIERFADQRLGALATASGLSPKPVPEVLFVCTENAGRSQLAAALMHRRAGGSVVVRSAGSEPGLDISPVVRALLADLGLDVGGEFPKPITPEVVAAADVVITLGCGDACPVLPGRRYVNWDLPDLSGLDLETARAVRDTLDTRIADLVRELTEARSVAGDSGIGR